MKGAVLDSETLSTGREQYIQIISIQSFLEIMKVIKKIILANSLLDIDFEATLTENCRQPHTKGVEIHLIHTKGK